MGEASSQSAPVAASAGCEQLCSWALSMASVQEANGAFALNMMQLLCQDRSKNVFFSPTSMSSALAMVYLGAKGNTAAQMAKALCFHRSSGDVHEGFQSLLSQVNRKGTQYLLRTANRLFGEKTFEILSSFKESCLKFYHADLEQLDFAGAADESRVHINSWVAEKTENKIQDLLAPGVVDSLTAMVLVNAIYFKGKWQKPFKKKHTEERPFKVSKDETKPVQMMFQKSTFPMTYIREISTQILVLPYTNQELDMVIMLPDENTDLKMVEDALTYERFAEWTRPDMREREVEVLLPRFVLTESYDLEAVLGSLGMTDAFDPDRADFSGITASRPLSLSKAVHKAFVEVNEEGTEAAAATAAVMMEYCAYIVPRFCADRPFLFFIQHRQSRTILFCGRFVSP